MFEAVIYYCMKLSKSMRLDLGSENTLYIGSTLAQGLMPSIISGS